MFGCHAELQQFEVGLVGCRAVTARMRSPAIVQIEISTDRCAGLADAVIGPQIHLLVFDAAPQPLDEDIIPPGAFAIHADRNAVAGEHAGEGLASELPRFKLLSQWSFLPSLMLHQKPQLAFASPTSFLASS